jgi:hypothetical protein
MHPARVRGSARPSSLSNFAGTANLVLQDAVERIFVQNLYADIPRGVYLVRGENVLVLGEIVWYPRSDAPSPSGSKLADGSPSRISIKTTMFRNHIAKHPPWR